MANKKTFTLGGNKNVNAVDVLKEKKELISAGNEFNLQFIKIENIIPNEKNTKFRQIDIDTLARSIEDVGLQHNLVVLKCDDGTYKLISGERRYRAISKILAEKPGFAAFKAGVPCKVVSGINETDEEIQLIRANTDVRELTVAEKRDAILRLIDLYEVKKKNGEAKAVCREVAEDLNMTLRMVQVYATTAKLIPELEEMIDSNNLNIAEASKIAALDEDTQKYIYGLIREQGSISSDEIRRVREFKEADDNERQASYNRLVELEEEEKSSGGLGKTKAKEKSEIETKLGKGTDYSKLKQKGESTEIDELVTRLEKTFDKLEKKQEQVGKYGDYIKRLKELSEKINGLF